MDKTKENLMRIKAYDAEEGEWRTIKAPVYLLKMEKLLLVPVVSLMVRNLDQNLHDQARCRQWKI